MPGKKKKPFIDKKNAVKFSLAHRSQRDPLQADDDAPQMVLLAAAKAEPENAQLRKNEQAKYGIYFDDDYDYMQHLRDADEINEVELVESFRVQREPQTQKQGNLELPSSVFASETEMDVGLLNKAVPLRGPQPDWDPDIVAGLDDDFDFDNSENELEDDFVVQAMDGEVEYHENESELDKEQAGMAESRRDDIGDKSDDSDVASDEAEMSDAGSDFDFDDGESFTQEETKSRFTNYSMTSSVIRRNEGLTFVDDRFEKIYEQYDDEEIGALDQDEIRGFAGADSQLLNNALEEFEQQMKQVKLKDAVKAHEGEVSDSSDSDSEMIEVAVDEKPKEKWDCESILSTYSTLYNHPKLIEEPRKVKPVKMTTVRGADIPADVLAQRGLTKKQLQQQEKVTERSEYVPTFRPKDETKEERKARKNLVKEDRRARREEKKSTKLAFKAEKKKQEKDQMNNRQATQGVKIL